MSGVSTKPYVLRAIYEWCVDQGFTPHIAVVVDEHTVVPPGYARDGQIVLNLGSDATHQLLMGNDVITFQARFGGVAHALSIPVANVAAIYARENGRGMAFEPEVEGHDADVDAAMAQAEAETGADEHDGGPPEAPPSGPRPPAGRGHLKVVK